MKTKLRIILTLLLCTALFLCLSSEAFADTVASGTCGEKVNWSLDSEGVLEISGIGAMTDYDAFNVTNLPWKNYRENITRIEIGRSVTRIGSRAFYHCGELENMIIPSNIQSIGDEAFSGCS